MSHANLRGGSRTPLARPSSEEPPVRTRTRAKQAMPRVADVMTQVVATLTPETPVQEAIDLFADRHISGAPVVSERGEIVGVVTMTDILRAESSEPPPEAETAYYLEDELGEGIAARPGDARTVLDIATRKVVSIDEDASLAEAARILLTLGIRRLLVSRSGKFAGLLSATDILKWVAEPALAREELPPAP